LFLDWCNGFYCVQLSTRRHCSQRGGLNPTWRPQISKVCTGLNLEPHGYIGLYCGTMPRRARSLRTLWPILLTRGKVVELTFTFPTFARRSLFRLHKSYVLYVGWGTQVLCTRSSPLTLTKTFGMARKKPIRCSTSTTNFLVIDVILQPNRESLHRAGKRMSKRSHQRPTAWQFQPCNSEERISIGHAALMMYPD
jgi:hypothetical protein